MTDLTILLPLKGRHLHTLRFLWHANMSRLPYCFLIADGQVHPAIARMLAAPRDTFPNLNIEYVRYADDVCYGDYFRKLADATSHVRTQYVMQADNDDFLVRSGIDRCMTFLDANRDYACCGGGVGGFALHRSAGALNGVTGTIQSLGPRYHDRYVHQDYASSSAADRVRQNFETGYTLYYNVYNAPAMTTICRECAAIDFGDLRAHETFFGARAKSLGKCKSDHAVMSYIRQAGTSLAAANMWKTTTNAAPDVEIRTFTDTIARAVADADGIDETAFAAELRGLYRDIWYAGLNEYRASRRVALNRKRRRSEAASALRSIVPKAAVNWRRQWLRRKARKAIVNSLLQCGASEGYIATFQRELADIEALLEGPQFAEFVQQHAPALISAELAHK